MKGSTWHRWDLHFQTPSFYDYHNKSKTNQEIVDELLADTIYFSGEMNYDFIVNRDRYNQRNVSDTSYTEKPKREIRSGGRIKKEGRLKIAHCLI